MNTKQQIYPSWLDSDCYWCRNVRVSNHNWHLHCISWHERSIQNGRCACTLMDIITQASTHVTNAVFMWWWAECIGQLGQKNPKQLSRNCYAISQHCGISDVSVLDLCFQLTVSVCFHCFTDEAAPCIIHAPVVTATTIMVIWDHTDKGTCYSHLTFSYNITWYTVSPHGEMVRSAMTEPGATTYNITNLRHSTDYLIQIVGFSSDSPRVYTEKATRRFITNGACTCYGWTIGCKSGFVLS